MILDLLGILGGFYEAIFIFIGAFAGYLSAKFLQANIAKSYFLRRKNADERLEIEDIESGEMQDGVENQFERIDIGKL